MSKPRKIERILKSTPTIEGAGVHLKRAFGFHDVPLLDPFLLLDDFHSDTPAHYLRGFPWHPHRGIETITYVFQGSVEHGDSMGNRGTIHSGDVQWMTAGSGIVHQEMPKGREDGLMWGVQLWANLPASNKMMDPRYRDVGSSDIPEVTLDGGVKVKIICGELKGERGPVRGIVIDPEYLDITVPPHTPLTLPVKAGHRVFAYVVDGGAYFERERDAWAYDVDGANYFDFKRDCLIGPESAVLFEDGDEVAISTEEGPVRFLLLAGKPLREPVAWQGPIVMNTREELRQAFQEYQSGTFIKPAQR
ncbi:MAG: pirin family protein [Bryobacteraceae bacterium]|jgi:redox-sensitive bicupin YhaK (pirin superfamily)